MRSSSCHPLLSCAVIVVASSAASFAQQSPAAPSASPAPEVQPEGRAQPASAPDLTEVLFKNLKARAIGPATMGGRVSDIAIDTRKPGISNISLATGGVCKT